MEQQVALSRRTCVITQDLMKRRSYKVEGFCEAMGCSAEELSGYMTARLSPDIEYAKRLAVSGVNLKWLYSGNGNPYVDPGQRLSLVQIGALADCMTFSPEVKRKYLKMAERIIDSESMFGSTLAMTIEVYNNALDNEKKCAELALEVVESHEKKRGVEE